MRPDDPKLWDTLPDGVVAKLGPVRPRTGPGLPPGQLALIGDEVRVGTGTTPVALTWIAPAGRKAIDARDWWRGARLSDAATLGEA